MRKDHLFIFSTVAVIALGILACGLGAAPVEPTENLAPDGETILHQWGATASASSQYGSQDWNASQACGAPNTSVCEDAVTAWASASSTGYDWLEVGFVTPVVPSEVRIYESYTPGQIVRVELRDVNGSYHTVWEGSGLVADACPRVFPVLVEGVDEHVTAVRITVDQTLGGSWDEIDAVDLVGTP